MNRSSSQVFCIHILAGNGLHHSGTCQEHIRGVFHHKNEVGQSRRINGTACAGAKNAADLRYHAAGKDVALEYLAVTSQRADAFLDACAARVVDANHRCAVLHSHVHDLANLLTHCLGQRSAVHGEVLCADIDKSAVDSGRTNDHSVAKELLLLHAEVVAAMELEHIVFLERTFVDEHLYTLTCGVFSTLMLLVDGLLSTSQTSLFALGYKLFNLFSLFAHNI